jgi:FAD/FMN-containing dehydrogenase
VGAATRWGAVVPRLSELGLAALHGSSPDVGIVGYSLGGGIGWLARAYGMQCNSVTAIELVTADGDLIRTDAVHESDLHWALRGGGGNFGIVTAIEFAVYPIHELYAGAMFFELRHAGEVLRRWRDLLPALPDEMTAWASVLHVPDLPFVPEPLRARSFAVVSAAFLGDEAAGRALLAPIRGLVPVIDTFAMVPPVALADLAMDPPSPMPYLTTHDILGELPDRAIDEILGAMAPGSAIGGLQLRPLGGALRRTVEGAGARATLPGEIATFGFGIVLDEASGAAVQAGLRELDDLFAGSAVGAYGSFVEVPAEAERFWDAATWARLGSVKSLYDPNDVFRGNHHIAPSSQA